MIVHLYWQDIQKYPDITYIIRRIVGMLAYVTATVMTAVVTLNVMICLVFGDTLRAQLNTIYHLGKPIFFFLALIAFAVPQSIFRKFAAPVIWVSEKRRQQQNAQLEYLASILSKIAPLQTILPLPAGPVRRIRLLTDISDCREVILSHMEQPKTLTPHTEADYILRLLHDRVVYTAPGNTHPATLGEDSEKYYLQLAKILRQKEPIYDLSPQHSPSA